MRSPWTWFVLLALCLMGTVNFLLYRVAANANRDLVERNPYEAGLAYQGKIDARTRFLKSGLKVLSTITSGSNQQIQRLQFHLTRSDGKILKNARVIVAVARAETAVYDGKYELLWRDGSYLSDISGPAGFWNLHYTILIDDQKYEFEERIYSQSMTP